MENIWGLVGESQIEWDFVRMIVIRMIVRCFNSSIVNVSFLSLRLDGAMKPSLPFIALVVNSQKCQTNKLCSQPLAIVVQRSPNRETKTMSPSLDASLLWYFENLLGSKPFAQGDNIGQIVIKGLTKRILPWQFCERFDRTCRQRWCVHEEARLLNLLGVKSTWCAIDIYLNNHRPTTASA